MELRLKEAFQKFTDQQVNSLICHIENTLPETVKDSAYTYALALSRREDMSYELVVSAINHSFKTLDFLHV